MSRLNSYLAGVVWRSTLLVLLVIVGIDALSAFIDEAGSRSERYGFREIGSYVLLTLPGRFYEFIPFAALVGCMMGLGQLASAGELVVMCAAGISKLRLVSAVLFQSVLMAGAGFLLGEYLAPLSEQRAQSLRSVALYTDQRVPVEQGIWQRDGNSFFQVRALTPEQQIFGVTVYTLADETSLDAIIRAESGQYDGGAWRLREARVTRFTETGISTESVSEFALRSNITPQILALENVEPDQLPLRDLRNYSRYLQAQGDESAEFEHAAWRKVLQPAAVAALGLVALSFEFGPLRDGTLGFRLFSGVMLCVLFRLAQDLLGPASLVFGFPPLYAALLPVLTLIVLGLLLLGRST